MGFCGCRSHSATSPAQQKVVQSLVQQPAQARVETEEEKSCHEFVQGFYDWYINGHLNNTVGPAWYDVAKKRPSILSPQLRQLLNWEAADEAATNSVGALDFDPFLASQDPMVGYKVKSVSAEGDQCKAFVTGSPDLRKVELQRTNGGWTFTDFDYSYFSEDGKTRQFPDDDLVHMLATERERVSVERKRSTRQRRLIAHPHSAVDDSRRKPE